MSYLQQLPNLLPLQKPSYSSFLPFFGSSAVCTCDLPNLLPLKNHPLKLLPLLFWVIYCMYIWATQYVTAKEAILQLLPLLFWVIYCMYIYATKSVTAIEAFLQLLPSLFLGHLPYVHIRYQICYRYRGLPTAPSFPFFGSSTVCTYKLPNLLPPGTKPDPTSCQHRDRN